MQKPSTPTAQAPGARPRRRSRRGSSRRLRAFTLLELLIVVSIIALLSGITVFSIQQMYDSTRRKAMFDEAKQIGTAMSFARDDIGFFPRLHLLALNPALIHLTSGNETIVRPGMDYYGFYGPQTPLAGRIVDQWEGPYMPINAVRKSFSRGASNLAVMRLPDTNQGPFPQDPFGDLSLVDWPTDTWGNPYVFYQVSLDAGVGGFDALRLPNGPAELGNFWTAIVSYGPNGFPGGNGDQIDASAAGTAWRDNVAIPGRLYADGDLVGNEANYTLRTLNGPSGASLRDADFLQAFSQSILSNTTDRNEVGILDDDSDDIFWAF